VTHVDARVEEDAGRGVERGSIWDLQLRGEKQTTTVKHPHSPRLPHTSHVRVFNFPILTNQRIDYTKY